MATGNWPSTCGNVLVAARGFEPRTSSVSKIQTGLQAYVPYLRKPHLTCSNAATASHDERSRTSVRPTADGLRTDSWPGCPQGMADDDVGWARPQHVGVVDRVAPGQGR